jgi:MEMO1 family protein
MGSPVLEDAELLSAALYDVMDENTLLIISADLSHYHPYDDAVRLDTNAISSIEKLDAEQLLRQIRDKEAEIDAPIAVLGAVMLANKKNASAKILKYANSGDVTGDKSAVVGYSSIVIYIPESSGVSRSRVVRDEGEMVTKEQKQQLMRIARYSIIEAVAGEKQDETEAVEIVLREKRGAFVTIKKHGRLRGCIGYISAVKPLYETVKDVAKSAAVNDYRFGPVTEDELKDLELEISVLTPLEKLNNTRDIIIGKHGLYMKKGLNSGLLLPQVAAEYGWSIEEFLKHTCLKAGLSPDAWKDGSTDIYTFSAEVFDEEE